jgi:hypothetical protein
LIRKAAVFLFAGAVLVLSTTHEADARTWAGWGAWAAASGQQSCLFDDFSAAQNSCQSEVTVALPLDLDTAGAKRTWFCGNVPPGTSFPCVAVSANSIGTEYTQTASVTIASQTCGYLGAITVPSGGSLYLQCNLSPGATLASAVVDVP